MVTIQESGMTFGPFQNDQIYQVEKAEAYKSLGQGVKVVEFIYKQQKKNRLFFIEAKSSSPKPVRENFERYIEDIAEKFNHSFSLWFTLNLGLRNDNVSQNILNVPIEAHVFRFILVINGHKEEWLPPIKAALERKMMADIKIWKHEIIVINDEQARNRGLIQA